MQSWGVTKDFCLCLDMELMGLLRSLDKKRLSVIKGHTKDCSHCLHGWFIPITVLAHTNKYPPRHGHSLKDIRNHSPKPAVGAQSQTTFDLPIQHTSPTPSYHLLSQYYPQNTLPTYLPLLRVITHRPWETLHQVLCKTDTGSFCHLHQSQTLEIISRKRHILPLSFFGRFWSLEKSRAMRESSFSQS